MSEQWMGLHNPERHGVYSSSAARCHHDFQWCLPDRPCRCCLAAEVEVLRERAEKAEMQLARILDALDGRPEPVMPPDMFRWVCNAIPCECGGCNRPEDRIRQLIALAYACGLTRGGCDQECSKPQPCRCCRAERAEAQVQRVREVCKTDSFVADFDGLYPTVVEVEDILRALDGGV